MRLVIKNVGRVSSADVELGGVTVLAGANGTGKSTVSRSLMTLSSVSRRVNVLILSERIRSVLGALRDSFHEVGGGLFLPDSMPTRMRDTFLPCLSAEWWQNAANVIAWLRERNEKDFFVMPPTFLDEEKCLEAIRNARPQVIEAINRSDDEYVRHNCRKAFAKAFNRQIGPVFTNDEGIESIIAVEDGVSHDNDVSVRVANGNISGYSEIGRTFYPTVAYFEPLNYVDFVNSMDEPIDDRYTAGSLCSCRMVRKDPPKNLSLEEQTELDEAMRIVQEIIDNIHGRLVKDGDNIKFSERFSDGDHLMDVQNIASGMKTMAAIVRAVENRSVRRGSMIIIDEPETNLHPEWQVSFARFLVCLSKRLGVSLLLNTHSPYFLQAIRVYSRRLDVENRYYNMVPDSEGDSFHTDEVTERIEEVFKSMARPFDDLRN